MFSISDAPRPALELLAPAKNAEFGEQAILHGADAIYIGGPAFGARAAAGNSVADIERLARFAHRYGARVLVALNTLMRDDELEAARRIAWECHAAGVDALILQDMGLLELDLPPIALHASTQTDIRNLAKARFLASVGFSQMVLARELSLDEIRAIAQGIGGSEASEVTLEYFVHGSLCVSYSGLCNLSYAQTGRSANRGDCAQPCRLPYTLIAPDGRKIAEDRHLLSLKDNNQTANLRALIDAGIRSFKIEGRLKDLTYVKNVTAHYRRALDEILEQSPGFRRASSGKSEFSFVPAPEKTFNRGATDYFVRFRQTDIGAFDSPKYVGERIGKVIRCGRGTIDIASTAALHNGDGISFYAPDGTLVGARINRAEAIAGGYRLSPALSGTRLPEGLVVGSTIYRNRDQEFERLLEKPSAERRIDIDIALTETPEGFSLRLADENGIAAEATLEREKTPAQDPERARASLREALTKLGSTIYRARRIDLPAGPAYFLPASEINALRRAAVAQLEDVRAAAYRKPPRRAASEPPSPYPEDALDYLGNVANTRARAFYEKHGVRAIEPAFEANPVKGEISLMITKHCLRYSFNLCPKQVKGLRPEPMQLQQGKETLTLRFDCKACEMHVIGKLRRNVPLRTLTLYRTTDPAA